MDDRSKTLVQAVLQYASKQLPDAIDRLNAANPYVRLDGEVAANGEVFAFTLRIHDNGAGELDWERRKGDYA